MDEDDFDPWWRRGVCAQIGPDLFFVDESNSVAEAKKACAICPVRMQCLADALQAGVEYGIFGGFARDHRRMLRIAVDNGADPMTVAARAIQEDNTRRSRTQWK